MGCLGTHFAFTADEGSDLIQCAPERARLQLLWEIEERYYGNGSEFIAESGKTWDGMHRALTDGRFAFDNGTFPLSHVVMGGKRLYGGTDWKVVLKTPEEVRDVAVALESIDEKRFKSRYWSM